MKFKIFGSTMLAILGWQTASAVEVSWFRQVGSAINIAGDASGSVWIAGTDRENANGYTMYKWDSKSFVKQDSLVPGKRLTATTNGQLWLVNDVEELWGQLQPGYSLLYLRKARDVVAGGDNTIYIISTEQQQGGYRVYQRTGINSWTYANFAAVNIAVDKAGNIWAIDDTGAMRMFDAAAKTWSDLPAAPAKARSFFTGLSSGAVWLLGFNSVPGGYPIFQWNSTSRTWEPYGTYGAVAIAEAAGKPWIVQSDGKVYSKADAATPAAPVDATQTWPLENPQLMPPIRATQTGKLLCSSTAYTNDCTDPDTKADYVGSYTLFVICRKGFYDPIYGGTCWECPPGYDGRGDYIRSSTSITSDTACWRAPKEATGYATKVKSPAWAWDCPAGSFWDGYSPDGAGGSCWQCPTDLPRRTAAAVWASNACATPINQTARAIFISYNGCAKPDATTMNLPGLRTPGQPFFDTVSGGGCYACPITDESGNFIIADRNTNSLVNKDTNTGCTIKLKWQPASFYDPGLAYMYGVKDLIWNQRVFDGTRITGFLYDQAEALGKGDGTAAAKAWVTARWQEIAANPYNSDQFRAFIFGLMKDALKKDAATRTLAEKTLLRSFTIYIQQRRTYLAQQALAMYDAWKQNDDLYRAQTGQTRSWSSLFYYGTVPLDFQGTLSGLIGLGAAGGGTIGAVVKAAEFARSFEVVKDDEGFLIPTRESSWFGLTDDLSLLKSAQGLIGVSGAAIVQAAAAILTSIAIDQFVAIETARPKLVAALNAAQQPVDLDQLSAADNGHDMMLLFWSKAMDTWDQEDPQVVQLAAMAQARAEQSGYAVPPKSNYLVPGKTTDRVSSGTGASNGYLLQSQKLVSSSKAYELDMQADGNLVIYTASRQAIWSTGTNGKGTAPYELAMQADGNLVVFGSSTSLWSTGAKAGTAPFTLVMQDDGNLVVYDLTNQAVWASGTNR